MDLIWSIIYVTLGVISITVTLLMPTIYYKYKSLRQHPAGIFTCISICEAVSCYLLIMPHVTDSIQNLMDSFYLTQSAHFLSWQVMEGK